LIIGPFRRDFAPIRSGRCLVDWPRRPIALPMREIGACAPVMTASFVRHLLAAQAGAMLVAAIAWWRVWRCPCEPIFRDAALWTGLSLSQGVVVIDLLVLRGASPDCR
jgi:hypothetical protein